jgi:hypothetical protein
VAEVAGYLLYAIPMLIVVLWPRDLRFRLRRSEEIPPVVGQVG